MQILKNEALGRKVFLVLLALLFGIIYVDPDFREAINQYPFRTALVVGAILGVYFTIPYVLQAYRDYRFSQLPSQTLIVAPLQTCLIITLPSTPWEPSQATGLMNTLFQLPNFDSLTFRVVVTATSITWQIILPSYLTETVSRTVISFYPQAEIVRENYTVPFGSQTRTTFLQAAGDYFMPISYAADYTDSDPLASVVGSMANLEPGEQIVYFLTITRSTRNYTDEGMKKITHSKGPLLAATLVAAGSGAHVKGPKSLDKYEGNLQRMFEEKLFAHLHPATVGFTLNTKNDSRARVLLTTLLASISSFSRPNGNFLTDSQGHPLILNAREAATLWHLPSDQFMATGVTRSSGAKAPLPAELLMVTSGLLIGHNNYQGRRRPVYVVEPDRITHMNIVGKTRVGKTTFMQNLIHQDIAEGRGVGVIDPHGDLVQNILESSVPANRENDVVLFDLTNVNRNAALNLLYVPPGVSNHAAVGLTLGVMKKIFAEQWSATRMEDALYSALAVLCPLPGATIRDVSRLFNDNEFRARVLDQSTDTVALEYWNDDYGRMSENYRMEVARPIMNRIRAFYRNPVIEQIVVQPTSVDFRGMMDDSKIFLASLAGEATQAESAVLGALLISKLQMAAMSQASTRASDRKMYYLYIDEVQNFVTTSLSTMFSEAAKYGLSLTVANQFLSQLEGGTLDAILGNTGTTVMFACGSQDADDLGKYVKPTFDSQTLMNLDRFQAIVKMQQTGKSLPAFSIETPAPPEKPADAEARAQRLRHPVRQLGAPPETALTAPPPPVEPTSSVPDLNL